MMLLTTEQCAALKALRPGDRRQSAVAKRASFHANLVRDNPNQTGGENVDELVDEIGSLVEGQSYAVKSLRRALARRAEGRSEF